MCAVVNWREYDVATALELTVGTGCKRSINLITNTNLIHRYATHVTVCNSHQEAQQLSCIPSLCFNYANNRKAQEKIELYNNCVSFSATLLFQAFFTPINIQRVRFEMRSKSPIGISVHCALLLNYSSQDWNVKNVSLTFSI
jgi:hypothetical protein